MRRVDETGALLRCDFCIRYGRIFFLLVAV
jgi:hypothetical protein